MHIFGLLDELTSRQKMRQRRAKEERKREKHIDEVNDRQIGKIIERSSNIDVMSAQHFPSVLHNLSTHHYAIYTNYMLYL